MSKDGTTAWHTLLRTNTAYTLKADKGGKTVTWKKEDYLAEATRQLEDKQVYQELTETDAATSLETTRKSRDNISLILHQGGHINTKDLNNIQERPPKASAIYFLPKIHKEKRQDTGTFAGRPILAAMSSTTKDLDLFLADLTEPLLRLIPGSLQDTTALINDLEALKTLPEGCQLFSADVVSLYPSIPWEEGINSATRFYASHFHVLIREAITADRLLPPNPRIFKQMLTLVITKNIIHLQEVRWFHQISGTAMGCSISVYFANTFMYYRTKHLLDNPPTGLIYLGRYIDDLVGIWQGDKNEIIPAFDGVVDEHLQLTFVIPEDPLEALDLNLVIINGKIKCSLFRKPTDGHQYVHFTSMHPPALLKSIPYSQILRIRRNSSNTKDFDNDTAALLQRLLQRGYPYKLLLAAYVRAIYKKRRDLLRPIKIKKESGLTFITKFRSSHTQIGKAIRSLFANIKNSLESYNMYISNPIPLCQPRIAYSVGRRIGDGLGIPYKKGPKPN